ncbi:MAG: tRNA (N6-threonylcarbamoyladenosine(37)-N6)-methyltransferase TrmO [Desulfobulbus sp.]|jgi:L-fuculose-phosphate aldolase|nr:tRNA (N6-threonylcarbamoyladenosine(37)-N6)-methyltransferase TrmO [Desulfobulbus sp.]
MEQPSLRPIGVLHGDIERIEDAPKNFSISDRTGTLEIFPEYLDGLDGIEAGQTIVVLFWLHKASRDVLKVYPRGDRSRGLHGVFATRSPVRPNPIAISHLEVLSVQDNRIEVRGLDILNGTPVIDIKKELGPDQDQKTGC